jgi:hypothetical protein
VHITLHNPITKGIAIFEHVTA